MSLLSRLRTATKDARSFFIKRVVSAVGANGFILFPEDKVRDFEEGRARARFDRAQWKRWYKANQKYQRRLRYIGGCDPNHSSLRRIDVP